MLALRLGRGLYNVGSNPSQQQRKAKNTTEDDNESENNSFVGIKAINPGVANLPPTFCTDLANK